jgi:DNA polymerase
MFVGEGPGHDEDVQGIPFVGRAGQLLTDIIGAMRMKREEVYIANIVKCRPPENRAPEPDEIAACRGFLEKQIEIIAPSVIVCLGAVAVGALLGATGGITKIRGILREYRGIPVMPTFHPAYLLRSPDKKREVWQDMQKVMALLASGASPG